MSPIDVDEDRRLVSLFLDTRDEGAFLRLYRTHTPMLYRMAWRAGLGTTSEVDDVVQDVWLRATRALATFRFESTLRTWLVSILIRCLQERRRKRRDDQPSVPDTGATTSPDLAVDINRAIALLSDGQREVFLLHDVEGMTHEEVGRCLGISSGTSKSQLFEARRRLRRWLGSATHDA